MSKASTPIAFLLGAALGAFSGWYFVKERYAALTEQEIDSAKGAFHDREQKLKAEIADLKKQLSAYDIYEPDPDTHQILATSGKVPEKGDITEYAKLVHRIEEKQQETDEESEGPSVISPMEFGEIEEYAQVSLSYFADGILADERGVIVENEDELLGDGLSHFGEYEEDSVFVRNPSRKTDYEILRDLRTYKEFRKTLPTNI